MDVTSVKRGVGERMTEPLACAREGHALAASEEAQDLATCGDDIRAKFPEHLQVSDPIVGVMATPRQLSSYQYTVMFFYP